MGTTSREEMDLFEIARRMLAGKWWITGCAGAGLLGSVLFLHSATPEYRTEMHVAPAASSSGGKSQLGGLGGLAAMAGVSLGGSSQSVTPFDLYLETLTSRALAEALAKDNVVMRTVFKAEWDEGGQHWREPSSLARSAVKGIGSALGVKRSPWRAPEAAELQEFIRRNVVVKRPDAKDAPITKLTLDSENPKFASYLLDHMSRIADERVRRNNLKTASSYAAYLSQKLRTEMVAEYRRDLSQALAEQEKSIMMASSSTPYAAMIIEEPTTATKPVRPNSILVLLLGLAGGAMLGCIIALINFRELWARLR